MLSERGKPLILYEGHKFYKYRQVKTTGEICWRCIKKECTMKLYTVGEADDIFSKISGYHNHNLITVNDLNRQKVNNSLKRKICDDALVSEKP